MPWLSLFLPISCDAARGGDAWLWMLAVVPLGYLVAPWHRMNPMPSKPSTALVVLCGCLAVASMAAAVYFGGTGRVPLAMVGTTLFVVLGGITFELARRRSV